jgi:hypothetical protein
VDDFTACDANRQRLVPCRLQSQHSALQERDGMVPDHVRLKLCNTPAVLQLKVSRKKIDNFTIFQRSNPFLFQDWKGHGMESDGMD